MTPPINNQTGFCSPRNEQLQKEIRDSLRSGTGALVPVLLAGVKRIGEDVQTGNFSLNPLDAIGFFNSLNRGSESKGEKK